MRQTRKIIMFIPLILMGFFSFVSSPPTAYAADPTIIYETDYEIDPATFIAPQTGYGRVSGNYWQDNCGVESSGCLYATQLGGGEAPGTQFSSTMGYFEDTASPVQESPFDWQACAVNFIEFDLLYVAPDNTAIGLEDNSRFKIWLSAGFSAGLDSDTYVLTKPFDELDGSVQGEYFHVALPLNNTALINSFAIEWRTSEIRTYDSTDNPVGTFESRIDNLKVWCDYQQAWVRPLAQADESLQWEMFDDTYAESLDGATFENPTTWVNAFSTSHHAPVHSAYAGTVMAITPLQVGVYPCGDDFISVFLNECIVFVPKEITNDSGGELYQLDIIDGYAVQVDLDGGGGSLYYVLANAPNYIHIGQEIGGGCVIGETIQMKQVLDIGNITVGGSAGSGGVGGGVTGTFQSTLTNTGYVGELLVVSSVDVRLYPRLTIYATDDSPCMNVDPRFINCLGADPGLTQAAGDGRTTSGNVTFDNPGYTLVSRNALIKEIDHLDADTEYGLSVDVESDESGGQIQLQLGQTVETHVLQGGDAETISIASGIHLADLTDYWTVQIKNISSASIKVLSICVSAGDVAGLPTACYFVNDSFDNGYANWDVSEGVGQRDGSITVPSGDTFSQEATLPADAADTTFQLYVDVYIWTEPGVTVSRTDYDSTVQLEYRFPDSGADWITLQGPSSSDTTTFSEFVLAAERQAVTIGTVSFQGFITIDVDTTGTVEFRPTVTTEQSGILGVGIDRACLRGDFNPGQGDPITGGNCQEIVRPQDEMLSSWTVWLWRQFNRFFTCDLMIVLRQIRNTTTSIYQLTGWSIRYWKAAYFYNVHWLSSDLFPWLNGQFNNMAKGSQSVFYINNQSGTNLWDFLVAIINNTLGPIINGLSSIFNNLITQLAGLLGGLLNFGGMVVSLIASLMMLLIQSVANLLTLLISGLINIILFILYAVFSLLQLIISGVFSLIFTVLTLIFALISNLFHVLMLIITNWNTATPTPIPGLPSCETDPAANYLCLPIYILNNTIFRPGTEGDLLLLLLVSYGCFELIVWVISSIRGSFIESTRSA